MTPSPNSAAADRAAALVRPEIAALSGYVPGEQPQGGEWIKLNTNENPYAPSPEVATAVTALLAGRTLAKYPDPVATRFRETAAEILGVEPDWILSGNGSDDLLTILVRTFVGTGEALRVPTPSYILYRTLAGIQGVVCEQIPYERDWSLGPAFCSPATAAGEPVRLAIIANPKDDGALQRGLLQPAAARVCDGIGRFDRPRGGGARADLPRSGGPGRDHSAGCGPPAAVIPETAHLRAAHDPSIGPRQSLTIRSDPAAESRLPSTGSPSLPLVAQVFNLCVFLVITRLAASSGGSPHASRRWACTAVGGHEYKPKAVRPRPHRAERGIRWRFAPLAHFRRHTISAPVTRPSWSMSGA